MKEAKETLPFDKRIFESEWREWLSLAADLWDMFSMVIAFITGILLIFLRDKPVEAISIIAGAAIAAPLLGMLFLSIIRVLWQKNEAQKLEDNINSIETPSAIIVLYLFLSSPEKSWGFAELKKVCEANRIFVTSSQDFEELKQKGFIASVGDYFFLTDLAKRFADKLRKKLEKTVNIPFRI